MPETRPRGRPPARDYLAHDGRRVRLAAAGVESALVNLANQLRAFPGVHSYLEQRMPLQMAGVFGWLADGQVTAAQIQRVLDPAEPVKGGDEGAGSAHP
jgi:hypothetical protein